MRSPSPARLLGIALALVTTLPAFALGAQFARRSTPAVPPQHAAAAPQGTPCGPTTVTQSSTQTITNLNSVACVDQNTGFHGQNSYWRAFDLRELGVLGPLDVCEVSFGIEVADDMAGAGQPLTVNLWDQADHAFPATDQRVLLGTATVTVVDQADTILVVPITATAPAYGQLVIEVSVPDRIAAGDILFFGTNTDPETGLTYISSETCEITTPVPVGDIGFPDTHFVLNVTGTVRPLQPAALTVGDTANYVVAVGDTFPVKPAWTNNDANAVTLLGTKSPILEPAGLDATMVDGNADYGQIAPAATADCGADCFGRWPSPDRPRCRLWVLHCRRAG